MSKINFKYSMPLSQTALIYYLNLLKGKSATFLAKKLWSLQGSDDFNALESHGVDLSNCPAVAVVDPQG